MKMGANGVQPRCGLRRSRGVNHVSFADNQMGYLQNFTSFRQSLINIGEKRILHDYRAIFGC
jgi:hypothetical protein